MERTIKLKTNRTASKTATATVSRFFNYSTNRINYSFRFYGDCKFFKSHNALRAYIMEKYGHEIDEDKARFWGLK